MWLERDEKGFAEEFANLAIDCVKPPEDRENLPSVCKRLEVKNILKLLLSARLYLDVRCLGVKRLITYRTSWQLNHPPHSHLLKACHDGVVGP